MVLLTPCIDYVIPFTELADGDGEQITAATPALLSCSCSSCRSTSGCSWGVGSRQSSIPSRSLEAFLFLIALPLTLAWLTELGATRSGIARGWQSAMGWLPVPMMGRPCWS